ncbi:unnamed protein product, partial [Ectocarpus fasciculatus]
PTHPITTKHLITTAKSATPSSLSPCFRVIFPGRTLRRRISHISYPNRLLLELSKYRETLYTPIPRASAMANTLVAPATRADDDNLRPSIPPSSLSGSIGGDVPV